MSVYPIKYKVLNKETGRKVSVTRWRVQIRKGGENLSKLFDEESVARSWEEQELHRINTGVPQNLIFDQKYQLEMPDMKGLLHEYFNQYMSKQAASSFKTNQNRCLRAIPSIPIYLKDLGPKIDNYRYQNTVVDAMLGRTYNKDHIEFGQFKIDTVDFWLLIAYMDSRRKNGIKDNTILREISTISSAFEKVYKIYPEKFPNGLMNPVKMLPRGEKPKAYLGRKRVLSDDEAVQIAEWMKLKANQPPRKSTNLATPDFLNSIGTPEGGGQCHPHRTPRDCSAPLRRPCCTRGRPSCSCGWRSRAPPRPG